MDDLAKRIEAREKELKILEERLAVLRIKFHSGRPFFVSPEAERAERIIASLMLKKGG